MRRLPPFFVVVFILFLTGCEALVVYTTSQTPTLVTDAPMIPTSTMEVVPTQTLEPEHTPTQEQLSTSTPTEIAVPTITLTPTPTSIPVYTELGEEINRIADILGWEIILCDESVMEEDLDNGIFLYRVDTDQFFCDLEGYIEEPVPEPLPGEYQFVLSYTEFKGFSDMGTEDGFHFAVCGFDNHYYPSPSTYTADEIVAMRGVFSSVQQLKGYKIYEYSITFRMWPLTPDQVKNQLYEVPEEEMLPFWFQG